MDQVLPLLTAFGLGSVVSAVVQAWLAQLGRVSGRSFDERKAAYIGLLEAYHRAAVERTDAAAKNFALWQMRCELVAPRPVREAIAEIVATNDSPDKRNSAHEKLKAALRADLGVIRDK
jgi:hypothetical protein